jgi:hypothetical protein
MKYYLRNKNKIAKEYGRDVLERIVDSLDMHFKANMILRDLHEVEGEPYKVFIIRDVGHTVNDIAFYLIRFEYGAHRLAFKEFIG